MKWKLFSVILLFTFHFSEGQFSTSGKNILKTYNSSLLIAKDSISKKDRFSWKSFIVPGALITYGVLAPKIQFTWDLSKNLQKWIWVDNPHSTTHIDNYLQFAPAAAVYGLNLIGIKGKNNLFDATMIYLLSNIIMNTTVFAVKNISHEQRPDGSDYYSFPSGHTAEAFASAEFLFQEYKDKSPWYGIGGYVVAATVGYLRMYNNKHWFHDVVAGAGFGIASTKLAYWLYPKIKKLFVKNKKMNALILPSYGNHIWGLSIAILHP
ncbi:MAG TPA: phosphatase PAP2 family protein [Puia sp.]|nr:phosphatase PAP2 family protein [Puia sp.]